MKALKIFVAGLLLILAGVMQAQVSVNVNIGSPPPWGPVGYTDVRYYYLPDVEAYYDINSSMFIYYGNGVWIRRAHLPGRYRNYDLYGGYKVVMTDYRGDAPYMHFKDHKSKYRRGYHGEAQRTYGERPGKGNNAVREGRHRNDRDGSHRNDNMKNNNGKGGGKGKKK